jgi:hypothetical protein
LVTISGSLDVTPVNGFILHAGDQFTIIENRGGMSIVGTFTGVPEGGTVMAGGVPLFATYHGGGGQDFVLTAVPEPGTLALGGVAIVGWVAARRRSCRNLTLPTAFPCGEGGGEGCFTSDSSSAP